MQLRFENILQVELVGLAGLCLLFEGCLHKVIVDLFPFQTTTGGGFQWSSVYICFSLCLCRRRALHLSIICWKIENGARFQRFTLDATWNSHSVILTIVLVNWQIHKAFRWSLRFDRENVGEEISRVRRIERVTYEQGQEGLVGGASVTHTQFIDFWAAKNGQLLLDKVTLVHNDVHFGRLFALLKYFGLLVVPLGPVKEARDEHFVAVLQAEHHLGQDGNLGENQIAIETQTIVIVRIVVEVVHIHAESSLKLFGFNVGFEVEESGEAEEEFEEVGALEEEVNLAEVVVGVARGEILVILRPLPAQLQGCLVL